MRGNFSKSIYKCSFMIMTVCLALCTSRPSEGNYDTVMAGDQESAESMHYQNFDTFYNAELESSPMSELDMQESRDRAYIRPPQPISEKEKRLQESDTNEFDVQNERRKQWTLKKGNSRAKRNGLEWERFDYDSYIN